MANLREFILARREEKFAQEQREREKQRELLANQPSEDTGILPTLDDVGKIISNTGKVLSKGAGAINAETIGNLADNLRPSNPNHLINPVLDTISEYAHKAGDYFREGDVEPARDSAVGTVANELLSGLATNYEGLGRFIGSNESADNLKNAREKLYNPNRREAPGLSDGLGAIWDYVTDVNGLPTNAANMVGTMIPELAATALVPEAAIPKVLSGLGKVGGDKLLAGLLGTGENALRRGAAKTIANGLPNAIRYGIGSAPVESMVEGGFTKEDALRDGKSREQANAEGWKTFAVNLPLLAASNFAEGLILGSPLARVAESTSIPKRALSTAGQVVGRGALGGVQQGTEEALQNATSKWAQGKGYSVNPANWNEEQQREFKEAFYSGALFGLLGGAGHALNPDTAQNDLQRGEDTDLSTNGYYGRYAKQSSDRKVEDYKKKKNNVYNTLSHNAWNSDDNLVHWGKNISGGANENTIRKVIAAAKKHGLDPRLALSVATAESNINQDEISEVGAIGVMQLMPETAAELGVDPYNEDENIDGGVRYLKEMLDKTGDTRLATAAYNAGLGAVQNYGGIPSYGETQAYVDRIHSMYDNSPEYSETSQSNPSENIYTGENGQAEGKYWNRQTDNVSIEGLQPQGLNAIDMLGKWFYEKTGKPLILTSGTDGTSHTDGEHSHYDGWKFDVNDWDGNSDGYLVTADGSKGTLTDEFIAYGRSLGLGMNWERDHIDVALDGKQWDGNGENAGGFNPSNNRTSSVQSDSKNISNSVEEDDSNEKVYNKVDTENDEDSGIDFEDNFFGENEKLTKFLLNDFVLNKLENADDAGFNFFSKITDDNNQFVDTEENRKILRDEFGDELREFFETQGNRQKKSAPVQQAEETPQAQKTNTTTPEVKVSTPNLDNIKANRFDLVSKVRQVGRYASKNNNFELMNATSKAEQSGDVNLMNKIVQENPIPAEFVNSEESAESNETEVTSDKPKIKDGEKIKNKDLKLATAEVSDDKKSRVAQGKAILRIAKAYGVELEDYETNSLLKGSKKIFPVVQDKFKSLGIFTSDEKATPEVESDSSKFKRLSNSYIQSQKNLDTLHSKVEEILRAGDTKQSQQALDDWGNALQKHRQLGEELRGQSQIFVPESRRTRTKQSKSLSQLESELADLREQQGVEKEIGLGAIDSGNEQTRLTATDNYKRLGKQIEAKQAEIEKYKKSPDYVNDLLDERAKLAEFQTEGKTNPRITAIDKELARLQSDRGGKIKSQRGQIQNTRRNIADSFERMITDKVHQQRSTMLGAEQKQKDFETKRLENAKDFAGDTISSIQSTRARQGRAINFVAEKSNVNFPDGLSEALNDGNQKAIEIGQQLLRDAGIKIGYDEGVETPTPQTQNQIQPKIKTPARRTEVEDVNSDNADIKRKARALEISANSKELILPEGLTQAAKDGNAEALQLMQEYLDNPNTNSRKNSIQENPPSTSKKTYHFDGTKQTNTQPQEIEVAEKTPIQEEKIETPTEKPAETILDKLTVDDSLKEIAVPYQEFLDGKIAPHNAYEKIEEFEESAKQSKSLSEDDLKRISEYADNLKSKLVDATHEKDISEVETNEPAQQSETSTPTESVEKNNSKTEIRGDSETIYTDYDSTVKVTYKVIETEDVISSHIWDSDGRRTEENSAYPKKEELQPRDRSTTFSAQELVYRANHLNPARLMSGKNVNQGAPVVRSDNVVLNGNGRVLTLERAYQSGKADEYKQYLIDNAEKYGLDADKISKMKRPILTRETENNLSKKLIQDIISSRTGGTAMRLDEGAKIDAKKIRPVTLQNYINDNNLPQLRREIIDDIAPFGNTRRNAFYGDKDLSVLGVNSADNALFALAYNNKSLISRLSNSDEAFSSNLRKALLESAPYVVKANKVSSSAKYNLGTIIAEAASVYIDLKNTKKKFAVDEWLSDNSNNSLFGAVQKAKVDIVDFINKTSSSSPELRGFFRTVANTVVFQHNEKQTALWDRNEYTLRIDEIVANTKDDIMKRTVLFDDEENNNFSVTDNPDVTITNDMIVADKDLTSQQKKWTELGDDIGLTIKFFNGNKDFSGVYQDDVSYLNANGDFEQTFWHEATHYLSHNNPEMLDKVLGAVNFTDEQLNKKRNSAEKYEDLSDREIAEELLADNMKGIANRGQFLQQIAKQDKPLLQRLVSWLKSWYDKIKSYFKNPEGGLTRTQFNSMYNAFTDNLKTLKDTNGRPIFKVGRDSGIIQTTDSKELPTVPFQHKTKPSVTKPSVTKYSVNPSDNSNESLLTRAKNIFSGIRQSLSKDERWSKATTELLEELTNSKIRYNLFLGDDLAVIDAVHKMIRVQHQNDFDSLIPKVGEIVAKDLKLPTTKRMSNYIADWILTGALNNTSVESKEFAKAMRNNPTKAEILMKVRQSFQYYADLAPEEKYGVRIVDKVNKTSTQTTKEFLQEELEDDLNPLAALEEKIKNDYGVDFDVLTSVYKQARLFKGVGGLVAENMIFAENDEEVANARAALPKVFPNVDWSNFKPLARIIKDIGGKKNLKNFNEFLWAKLDKEMHIKNRSIQKDSNKYITLNDEKTADATIAKFENQFGQSQRDFVNFSNTLLAIMRDSGLIGKEKYDEIIKNWENYIPTHRVFDNAEDFDLTDSMRRKHGSKADIRNPMQVVARNAILFVNAAQKNKIKLQLANMARCGAYGKWISAEDFIRAGESAISFKENGKSKHLRVTPEVKRAIDSLSGDHKQGTFIAQLIHTVSSIVANLQTLTNPSFASGNPFRDAQEAFLYGGKGEGITGLKKSNPIATFIAACQYAVPAIGKAIYNTFSKNKKSRPALFFEWAAMGGSQASFVSADIDKQEEIIDYMSKTGIERWKSAPHKQLLRSLQTLSEELETGTRLAVYERKKNIYAAKNSDGKVTLADMEQAALDSRNATIDFARAGRSMRTLNKYFRFSNAAVQDIAKSFELFQDIFVPIKNKLATVEDENRLKDALLRISLGTILPTIGLFLLHKDDDWYKYATPQWQKDTSWILMDGVKIPKSYSFAGKLFSTWLEEGMKKLFYDEPLKAQRIFQPFIDALPSLLPTLLTPIVEGLANYSFFYKGPLVPIKEQQKASYEQYGEKTSEFSKYLGGTQLAEWLSLALFGKSGGISPRKIDNAIDSYTGIFGDFIQGVSNLTSDKKRKNFWDLTEFPMAKRFLFDPYKNPQVVADYYDLRSEQRELANTYRDSKRRGEDKIPAGYDEKLWKRIQSREKAMENIAKKQRALLENTKMPAAEMKKRYRKLTEQEIKIAKDALGR